MGRAANFDGKLAPIKNSVRNRSAPRRAADKRLMERASAETKNRTASLHDDPHSVVQARFKQIGAPRRFAWIDSAFQVCAPQSRMDQHVLIPAGVCTGSLIQPDGRDEGGRGQPTTNRRERAGETEARHLR